MLQDCFTYYQQDLGALSGACTAYYRYTEMNCVSKKSDWDACGIVATEFFTKKNKQKY